MDSLFGFLILAAAVGLVLLITYSSFRWLWAKGRFGQLALSLAAFAICWGVFDAIYPSKSFYISELERLAGVKLPGSVIFVEKTASFPDIHGDYSACFIVRLTPAEMTAFKAKVSADVQIKSGAAEVHSCDSTARGVSPTSDALDIDLSQRVMRPDATINAQVDERRSLVKFEWHLW